MTRLVVLSDTHMPRPRRELPEQVVAALKEADIIIHLGDFTTLDVASYLQTFALLYGVQGNNDRADVRASFPLRQRVVLEGHVVELLHGHVGGRTALTAARAVSDADLVLFGHSHRPWNAREGQRHLFNPGSPTDRRWFPYASFGLLDLEPGRIAPEIVPILDSRAG